MNFHNVNYNMNERKKPYGMTKKRVSILSIDVHTGKKIKKLITVKGVEKS